MKALFRTDASLEIGTGHVMRCLALADALRLRDCESVFICREHPGHLGDLIRQRGHAVYMLPEASQPRPPDRYDRPPYLAWLGTDWETDAEQTASLARSGFDLIVVDHYALDIRWESKLRPFCQRILAIDDLADREHDCDFLLDQNLIRDLHGRYADKVADDCELLLGPTYALLQPQYSELHDRLPLRDGRVRRILIYFGGADADNLTGLAISACLALAPRSVDIDVVANPKSPHIESLREQVRGHERIALHESLPSLAALMANADLAIGAAGVTSWERCCVGLPSLVVTLAENQRPIADELNRQGFIRWLGHKNAIDQVAIVRALKPLLERGMDSAWSERCFALVDGMGARRVADILTSNAASGVVLRSATRKDEASLAPEVAAWFRFSLRDVQASRIYMAVTAAGAPLGCVLFRHVGESWEAAAGFNRIAHTYASLRDATIHAALRKMRGDFDGPLSFACGWHGDAPMGLRPVIAADAPLGRKSLTLAICSDKGSWINDAIPELILAWLRAGHRVIWSHAAEEVPAGDLCFYLSYGRIVGRDVRSKYAHNLVVHESDLPKGRGWAPMTWQILEGAASIPVTLLEAADDVDAGPIYLQERIELEGHELNPEWRAMQAASTCRLCRRFVENYPEALAQARIQTGDASVYVRRRASDSRLDPNRSLADQFNLLRVVNNEDYPAFFELDGKRFVLRIEKPESA